jgi:hypothetical protein
MKYLLSWTHNDEENNHRSYRYVRLHDIADALSQYEHLLIEEDCTSICLCAILEESE